MISNLVHKKIIEFAGQEISQRVFEDMLRSSSSSNPMIIYWSKLDGRKARRNMYWGTYTGGKASDTRQQRGELALVSITDNNEWRTIQLNEVTRIRFENKTYFVTL